MFLNLMVSFLWQEWKDLPKTKQFFMKKMNTEFSDLMNSRTAARFIEQITILDLNLGKSLPVFKGATIMKVGPTKDATEVPKELDIALDLEYTGGCHMTIQVDFLFNKTAYFSVKLVCLRGRARLQFSRNPCTHWSLSFYEEPEMEFEAESHLEGKSIEQLTSLVLNHLRRTINKKHTLPSYKIRYLPFFPKLEPQTEKQDIFVHDSMITVGKLDVIVNGCSRLPDKDGAANLYCSLSVDVLPWKQLAENSRALWTTFEVEITRENTTASFGMTLSKDYGGTDIDKVVFVETIVPSSPADLAGLQRGDVIVSVEGQRIDSLKQAAKLIKNKTKFTANFQRPPSKTQNKSDHTDESDGMPVNFKNVAVDSEESDSEEEFVNIMLLFEEKGANEATKSAMRDLMTKSTELRQRSRRRSKEDFKDAYDGGGNVEAMRSRRAMTVATGGRSEVRSPEVDPRTLSPPSRSATMKPTSKQTSPTDEGTKNSLVIKPSTYSEIPGTKRTKEVPCSEDPTWGETIKFDISSKDRYLNVCVWNKQQDKADKDILIGHVTIPLMDVVVQCLALGSKRHEQSYVLVSPYIDKIISRLYTHLRGIPGLNSSLIGGDISLGFVHYPSFGECNDSAVLEKIEELEKLKAEEEEWEQKTSPESENMEHNFILTQFYFPTRCNYCSKKIWRKIAFQCRNCALICHKKCLDSCRRFSSCLRSSGRKSRWFSKKSSDTKAEEKPNPSMPAKETGHEEAKGTEDTTTIKGEEKESEKIENEKSKEKSGDLALNQEVLTTQEHPMDDKTTKQKSAHEMEETSDPGVQEKGEAVAADMVAASQQVKEIGRELFSYLPPDARKKKLQDMMARLQVEIDEENETLGELYQDKKRTKDKKQKEYIASLITKSEERGQALAMLMLQYCAGLQDCADAEDEDCYEL